ncbi:hypothetical protein V8Q34_14750 [Blautia sp. JLR.GB0024]|uniref:hypothetical protein n=1 Tax=Blautia sp. JLR.GB0024 TaxID=3123295 RepID=UPI003007E48A
MEFDEFKKDALDKIEEYYDQIRRCDYWSHRKSILDSIVITNGLYVALVRKGILTKEEFDSGISEAKDAFADTSNQIQDNLKQCKSKKELIEKELLKYFNSADNTGKNQC